MTPGPGAMGYCTLFQGHEVGQLQRSWACVPWRWRGLDDHGVLNAASGQRRRDERNKRTWDIKGAELRQG